VSRRTPAGCSGRILGEGAKRSANRQRHQHLGPVLGTTVSDRLPERPHGGRQ
jgi:hypothetical protein